jgi:protein-tyrosine phosphatase
VIDSHCHLLPGLDDGPRSLSESLALARQLSETGVHTVICTPHYSRRFPTDHELASQRLADLREALAAADIALELHLAAEIASATALEAGPKELARRELGGKRLLVELEPDTPAGFVSLSLRRLGELGFTPVFAHPERCRAVRLAPRMLQAARAGGARVQVVASSLVGRWGSETAAAAWQMLDSGQVDILASDSHHARPGGLHIAAALELVTARLGPEAVHVLTEQGPSELISRPRHGA